MPKLTNAIAAGYTPQKSKSFIDLTGARFGRLVVLHRAPSKKSTKWACACDCGGAKEIDSTSLRRGLTTSCGCISRTHGGFGTRIYRIWANMLNRCRNENVPAYKDYGARGISVCAEWKQFAEFKQWAIAHGYADDLTIERVNCNGNYDPANCIWMPGKLQPANRRNVRRDAAGRPWCEIAAEHGISSSRYNSRVGRGWSDLDAATKQIPLPRRGATD